MAASHSIVTEVREELRNITDCNICCETCRDPRILPCFHTFCLSCISQARKKSNERSGDKMPCPLCRKQFTVPTNGFEELEKNFFVQRMTERRKLLERTSGHIPCDTCSDETNESNAVAIAAMNCLECHLNLCEQCCAHHRRSRLTREHTLREGASRTISRESEEALQTRMCRRHTDEEMKLYCKNCLDVLCPMCFIENHQGHERLSVVEAGDDFRRQIQVSINDIDDCSSKATIKKELIELEMDRIAKGTERLEEEVIKKRDDLKELVDKHAEIILEQLRKRESEKLTEVAIKNLDTKRHLVCLESYKNYLTSFVVNATNGEICKTVSDLNARATELRKENEATAQHQMSPYQLSLTATKLDKVHSLVENIIGKIEDADNEEPELISEENAIDENTDTSDVTSPREGRAADIDYEDLDIDEAEESMQDNVEESFETRSSLEQNIPGHRTFRPKAVLVQALKTKQHGKPIWGLTVMDSELFVVIGKSSQIEVYDSLSYKFKRQWKNLQALTDPQDIVSCASRKCLLIMNWGDELNPSMILKVNPTGTMLIIWPLRFNGGLFSITQESTVIVTSYGSNHLSEYSVDGELINEIKIPKHNLYHPQHTLKLANGRFLVCCGGSTDFLNRVCLIDQRGNVLKSFGGERGSDNQSLNRPLHLAVDGDRYIFVADWNNRRVLLLNSDLDFQMEFLTRTAGLKHPGRVFLDQSNNRLLLADNAFGVGPGQVLIFDIYKEVL